MLAVPYFLVRTVQQLFRLTPVQPEVETPRSPQKQLDQKGSPQQRQPQQQQQRQTQQQQAQPKQALQQREQTQQQSQTQQQNQSQQQKQQQQQQQQRQPQQQQLIQPQQISPQQNKPSQQQHEPAIQPPQLISQQQNKLPQQQQQIQQQQFSQQQNQPPKQQQLPNQQQSTTTPLQQQPTQQLQNESPKPTSSHPPSTPTLRKPTPVDNPDLIQAQSVASLQYSPPPTHLPSAAVKPEFAKDIAPSPPVAETSVKTSSKTLVLNLNSSADKMSFEWAQQQVEKFKFDFDQADKDKSGTLSFQEVFDVLHKVGFKGTQEEAKAIFGHLDRDRDQKITKEEFTSALKNLPRLSIKEFVLRKIFLKLDKDGSGFLSRSEIADATKSEKGVDLSADKISDLLVYLVKDDDEKVSYEEFLRVLGVESAATVMRQVFTKLDTDGSGFLTKDELLDAIKAESELKLQADKIADLLIYWCRDQDKKISYNEFVEVWLKQREVKPKK